MEPGKKSSRIETIAFVLIAITSTLTAGAVIYRTFAVPGPPQAAAAEGPTFVPEWQALIEKGVQVGDPSADVQIITFTDLECPFCRRFHAVAKEVAEVRGDIALTWLHFPLNRHRFARPAAHAAECAANEGRFAEFLDVVYERQDSLGLTSWREFAVLAGVTDTTRFAGCIASEEPPPRIQFGLDAAQRVGATGTPTILINGWRVAPPYTARALEQAIEDVMAPGVRKGS